MERLLTKQSRLDARQAWIGNNPTEKYKDIEILRIDKNYMGLIIWRGATGNPYLHYSYKTKERREETIKHEKLMADSRETYRKESK